MGLKHFLLQLNISKGFYFFSFQIISNIQFLPFFLRPDGFTFSLLLLNHCSWAALVMLIDSYFLLITASKINYLKLLFYTLHVERKYEKIFS